MSEIRVNNITNRDGSTGTTVAGIPVVDSTSHFVVPTGRTGQRYVDGGENIVRDGLVLHLDAKYSYPSKTGIGTTTSGAAATPGSSLEGEPYTWYDMSGYENHGQLKNGVGYNATNGGSLVFDGVNDYVDILNVINNSEKTYSIWATLPSSGEQQIFSTGSSNFPGTCIGLTFNSTREGDSQVVASSLLYGTTGNTGTFGVTSGITSNTWHHFTITTNYSGNVTALYIDSVSYPSRTQLSRVYNEEKNIRLGIRTLGDYKYTGKIAQVSIYNKALTASEVSQNFEALRSRFGI